MSDDDRIASDGCPMEMHRLGRCKVRESNPAPASQPVREAREVAEDCLMALDIRSGVREVAVRAITAAIEADRAARSLPRPLDDYRAAMLRRVAELIRAFGDATPGDDEVNAGEELLIWLDAYDNPSDITSIKYERALAATPETTPPDSPTKGPPRTLPPAGILHLRTSSPRDGIKFDEIPFDVRRGVDVKVFMAQVPGGDVELRTTADVGTPPPAEATPPPCPTCGGSKKSPQYDGTVLDCLICRSAPTPTGRDAPNPQAEGSHCNVAAPTPTGAPVCTCSVSLAGSKGPHAAWCAEKP